jgi:hypothetical protein
LRQELLLSDIISPKKMIRNPNRIEIKIKGKPL